LRTVNTCVTGIAGAKRELPPCDAVICVVPAPTIVNVLPEIVATAVLALE
jgi:hypothetical protein